MATYLTMQTRIADELDRADLTSQIKLAILSAVLFYERKRFYFSETSFTFSTVAGQEYYTTSDNAAIATAVNIERLVGTYAGLRVPLTKRSFDYLNEISIVPTTSRARPMDWAYRAEQIRLYPVPDAVYTITAYDIPRLTALSADSDSNAWTTDAEELIRLHAKVDLIDNIIRGPEMAEERAILVAREREVLAALYSETASREATGMVQPTEF